MRSVVCRGRNSVEILDVDPPEPGPGELLLALRGCGLCGTDLLKLDRASHNGRVLGHELVGTVTAAGAGVEAFEAGQRVVSPHHVACGDCRLCRLGVETRCSTFAEDLLEPGGFAEYVLLRERAVRLAARAIPEDLPDEAAIFLEPASCVLRGVLRSGLDEVETAGIEASVIVLGAGSMGLLHVLLLRARYPQARILVSEPDPHRRAVALRLGASMAVEPAQFDASRKALGDGDGADALFDTVGDPALLEPGLRCLRSGGTFVLFAHSWPRAVPAPHEEIFHEERRLIGTYSGTLAEQAIIFDLLCAGRLDPAPLVTHRMPLSRFSESLSLVRRPEALKIVLTPG